MSAETVAFGIALAVFFGGSIGLILAHLLPEKYTTGAPRDMIGAVVGLLTLLSALVLGLLIWTAYGVYAGQNAAVQTLASRVLQFDMALADYGPDADPVRKQLRQGLGKTLDQVWAADQSDANFAANNFAAALRNLREREALLAQLHPTTDAQNSGAGVRQSESGSARPVPAADVLRAFGADLLSAGVYGGRVGRFPVLRVRAHVQGEPDLGSRRACRRLGHRVGVPVDSRPVEPLFRDLPRLLRAARTGAGGDGKGIAPARRRRANGAASGHRAPQNPPKWRAEI